MTPVYKISLPESSVWAKLESHNPTGTHKDRSLGPWISYYAKQGAREVAISSSGNSAVSAAKYCQDSGITLHAFVRRDIEEYKLSSLRKNTNVILHTSKTPKRDALRFAREHDILNLRASTDDRALVGYEVIALELIEQVPSLDNIFIPTSSGATLAGIYQGYTSHISNRRTQGRSIREASVTSQPPSFYAVQTTKVHPIAGYFDKDFLSETTSYATAIVDNIAHRKDRVIQILKETRGGGFVISNRELEEAKKVLGQAMRLASSDGHSRAERKGSLASTNRIQLGWQSALVFAGFLKWRKQNPNRARQEISVCLFTD